MDQPTHRSQTPIPWQLWAATLVLVFAAYLPAMGGSFLFDDIPLLANQTCWRGLEKIPAMFGMGDPNACSYRPVRYLTFAFDYSIGGLSPVVMHVGNLVYHVLTGLLVFFLLRRWASNGAAALVAALWLLHPVQADSVAYVSGRRDLVSTLFYTASFLMILPRGEERFSVGRTLAGLFLFGLALGAKEMAVTLPVVLIWSACVKRRCNRRWLLSHLRRLGIAYLILFGMAIAFVVHRGFIAPHSGMHGRWWGGTPISNFATSFVLLAKYIGLIVWPDVLIGDYYPQTIPLAAGFSDPRTLVGIGLLAILVGVVVLAIRRGWLATAFGIGWFLVTLSPVMHILPHHELFAEHYLYLPSIGLAAAVVPLVDAGLHRSRRLSWLTVAVMAALLTAATFRTADRAADYRSEATFYEEAARHAPNNGRVQHYLAVVAFENGALARARGLFHHASELLDPHTRIGRDSLAGFILCSDRLGFDEGVDAAISKLLDAHPRDAFGLSWRGRRLLEQNRLEEAVEAFSLAVEQANGRDPDTVGYLAMTYNRLARPQQALALIERYPHRNRLVCEQWVLALVTSDPPRFADALEVAGTCLADFPDSPGLLELHASLLIAAGRAAEADADIARLIELGAPAAVIQRLQSQTP